MILLRGSYLIYIGSSLHVWFLRALYATGHVFSETLSANQMLFHVEIHLAAVKTPGA